jgi:hypothetical protein
MKITKTLLAVLTLTALIAGCATNGYQKAVSTAASLQRTADRVDRGVAQIDNAMTALSQLVDAPSTNLQAQFKAFDASVSGVEAFARDLASRSASVQQQGSAYFQKWDEELTAIRDEAIRSRSADRKAAVMREFDRMKTNYDQSRAALTELIAGLKDIRTAIGTDLTPGGLEAIRGAVSKTSAKGVAVRQSLGDLAAQFKSLRTSLSASAPPPPAKS